MGCDGGTIPKRDELVRTKKKPEQKDKQSELSFKWGHCSINQEPLQTPIVACQLGRLYSKVAVLEALLDHTLPDAYKHIKSIKDIKELNLTDNPAFKNVVTKGDSYNDIISPYICPVIGLEMNGKYRFVYLWKCGCVLSERALKAVISKVCHKCQQPFAEEDIIVLNGTEEDLEIMKKRMEDRKMKIKAEKKHKKNNETAKVNINIDKKEKESKLNNNPKNNLNTSTHSNSKQASIVSKCGTKRPNEKIEIEDPDFKKTKLSYSVAKDPKATEVFKSLFTTHKSAEKQTKAHWITYNPFYN